MRTLIRSIVWVSCAASLLGACGGGGQPAPAKTPDEPPTTGVEPAPAGEPEAPGSSEKPAEPDPAAGASGAPAQGCTEMGCRNGYAVSLEPNARWQAGKYQFDVEVDGQKGKCTGSLPLPACGKPALQCTGVTVTIGESGCALPPAEHGFSEVSFGEQLVKKVSIAISRNGKKLVKQDFQPTYKRSAPNGPNCGPVCDNAHDTLKVF